METCTFFSHGFNTTEWNYHIYDHELLAAIMALKEWKVYLLNSEHDIDLYTNHKNLQWFQNPQQITQRQAYQHAFFQEYRLHIHHIPGKQLAAPDALLR